MKVSEAMRLADELGLPDLRNGFIQVYTPGWKGEKPACCAIGGAAVASRSFQFEARDDGMLTYVAQMSATSANRCEDWKSLRRWRRQCPVCKRGQSTAYGVVMHLYDRHWWSRTQIADWLDATEAKR